MAEALRELGVIEQPHTQDAVFGEIIDLAAKHSLLSYDASYLDLAIRLGMPLATLDEPLKRAAGAEGVPLVTVI